MPFHSAPIISHRSTIILNHHQACIVKPTSPCPSRCPTKAHLEKKTPDLAVNQQGEEKEEKREKKSKLVEIRCDKKTGD